jgi:hypothetical protein
MRLISMQTIALFICLCIACTSGAAERPKRGKGDAVPIPAAVLPPVAILSIIPVQAEPGSKVVLSGSGFERMPVFTCSIEITARVIDARQIEFYVPPQTEVACMRFT